MKKKLDMASPTRASVPFSRFVRSVRSKYWMVESRLLSVTQHVARSNKL